MGTCTIIPVRSRAPVIVSVTDPVCRIQDQPGRPLNGSVTCYGTSLHVILNSGDKRWFGGVVDLVPIERRVCSLTAAVGTKRVARTRPAACTMGA
jgi:hypothetical protein